MEKNLKSKNVSDFEFIKDTKMKEVLYGFSYYVFFMYEEIKNENLPKELDELKAHTILVYLGSIIEAITYYFANIKLTDNKAKKKYLKVKEFKSVANIGEVHMGIYEIKEISLNDNIQFYSLINGLTDRHLLDNKIIDKINYFRRMRNLIHINVLLVNEYELFNELDKAFTYTKEIIDEIKKKLK